MLNVDYRSGSWLQFAFGLGSKQSHLNDAGVGFGLDAVHHRADDPNADSAQELGCLIHLGHLTEVAADRQDRAVAVLAEDQGIGHSQNWGAVDDDEVVLSA